MADGIYIVCAVVATIGLTAMVVAISMAVVVGLFRLMTRSKED